MTDDIKLDTEITWCKGCGNFAILNAYKKAIEKLEEKGISKSHLLMSSGIGCHGKISDYVGVSGLYSIHGRSMTTIQGMKLGNPSLKVLCFGGDGDTYGEGLAHIIFAAKRNADITVIVHNNGAYALTTGQFSPTSEEGFKGPSMPEGNIEPPLNPLSLLLESGATFVARGYAGELAHLSDLIVEAVLHEGFSIIDVLQPSVVFNDTYDFYNNLTKKISEPADNLEKAIQLSKKMKDSIPIGILYKTKKSVYHKKLYGDWNPVEQRDEKKKRLKKIDKYLQQ